MCRTWSETHDVAQMETIQMSADLTKGSFRHFSSYYVIKILKTSKISIYCMFSQESNCFQPVTQSKKQTFLRKLTEKYNLCCHGNSFAYGVPTSFKVGYLISNTFVNTVCAYVKYLCSLYNCIHIKFTETGNILEILLLASL